MTGSETCEWFAAGFYLVCNSTGAGPIGKTTGQSTMGYSAEGKHYTFYGIDSTGWSDAAKGTLEADTKSRYTVRRARKRGPSRPRPTHPFRRSRALRGSALRAAGTPVPGVISSSARSARSSLG